MRAAFGGWGQSIRPGHGSGVLSLRAAAGLLGAKGPDALARIAAVCGFDAEPLPLDHRACDLLGLAESRTHRLSLIAHVVRGQGYRRALLITVQCHDGDAQAAALRDLVQRVALRLARRTPQLAWLCVVRTGGRSLTCARRNLALATWSPEKLPPRTAALVIDQDEIVDSDAETLSALAAVTGSDDTLTQARWLEVLSRESLTRRFYRALERAVTDMASATVTKPPTRPPAADDRRALALLYASRLLFLAFLEAKGWLDNNRDFLAHTYQVCLIERGDYHQKVLRPLFFGTLNTPPTRRAPRALSFGRIPFLNGGLFAATPLERRLRGVSFSDEAFGGLLGDVLGRFRFTAREDQSTWSEAAVDPEMLGKAFESLMAPVERHATGAYYTPQPLVERVTRSALVESLASPEAPADAVAAALAGERIDDAVGGAIRARVNRFRVLDPACGSGAFLVFALETLAALSGCGDGNRPLGVRRRAILTRSIFGVDVNPTAVWLCELRLWLAVVIETEESDPTRILPLPNLDRNVRVGDALASGSFGAGDGGDIPTVMQSRTGRLMTRLRDKYARASGMDKRAALRTIERAERGRAIDAVERDIAHLDRLRRDAVGLARGRDLFGAPSVARSTQRGRRVELRARARALRARLRALQAGAALPFSFAAHFADADADGGFDAVVGNPPWVRPHAIPDADRHRYRRDFRVCQGAGWTRKDDPGASLTGSIAIPHGEAAGQPAAEDGATRSRPAGQQFGAQIDLAAIFVERGIALARPGGVVALLVPAKLWRSLAGGGVRRLIAERTQLLSIEDWPTGGGVFDATVFPSLLVARRADGIDPEHRELSPDPRDRGGDDFGE